MLCYRLREIGGPIRVRCRGQRSVAHSPLDLFAATRPDHHPKKRLFLALIPLFCPRRFLSSHLVLGGCTWLVVSLLDIEGEGGVSDKSFFVPMKRQGLRQLHAERLVQQHFHVRAGSQRRSSRPLSGHSKKLKQLEQPCVHSS